MSKLPVERIQELLSELSISDEVGNQIKPDSEGFIKTDAIAKTIGQTPFQHMCIDSSFLLLIRSNPFSYSLWSTKSCSAHLALLNTYSQSIRAGDIKQLVTGGNWMEASNSANIFATTVYLLNNPAHATDDFRKRLSKALIQYCQLPRLHGERDEHLHPIASSTPLVGVQPLQHPPEHSPTTTHAKNTKWNELDAALVVMKKELSELGEIDQLLFGPVLAQLGDEVLMILMDIDSSQPDQVQKRRQTEHHCTVLLKSLSLLPTAARLMDFFFHITEDMQGNIIEYADDDFIERFIEFQQN